MKLNEQGRGEFDESVLNKTELEELWNFKKTMNSNYMSFQSFLSKMSTPEKRKKFYDEEYQKLVSDGFFASGWTPEDFEDTYGPPKKVTPSTDKKRSEKKTNPKITFHQVDFEVKDICDGKVVKEGMKGDIIWWIQTALQVENPQLVIDTQFGDKTKKEVANFQLKNKEKLKVTGEVDRDTWNLLYKGTQYACPASADKPEEKKDDKMKNIDDKPKEIENKIKKGPKIVKGVWIGEQVTKPVVKQDPKKVALLRATKVKDNQGKSCIDRFVEKYKLKPSDYGDTIQELEAEGDSPGGWAVIYRAINPKTKVEDDFYITSDGSRLYGIYGDDSSEVDIYCGDQDFNLGEFGNLSERQKQFVQYNVTPNSGYKVGINPGEEQYYDKLDITKVFTGASEYFSPNQYFIYKRKGFGVQERNEEYYQQIETTLNKVGWTYKKPDINTDAYNTKVDIRQQFPKYAEMFPQGLYIYFTGSTRSTPQMKIVSELISDIDNSLDSPEGKTCRRAIDVLYDAKEAYNKKIVYFSGDTELEKVREYVKRCQTKFEKNVLGRFLGNSLKRFEELTGKVYGPQGVLKFNLGEGLNRLIKTKLISLKEEKNNKKIVSTIVENRLKMIVESANKQKDLNRLTLEFFNELSQLSNQGMINENFGENLKNIFGSSLSSMPKTFFENIFDRILSRIDMNDSSLKKILVTMSEKNPSETVKAFKDCDSLSTLIAKTVAEVLYMNINTEKVILGKGLSLVKNLLGQEIKKDEFVQKIKNQINDMVCAEFTNLVSNSEKLLANIKGSTTNDLSVKL